MLDALEHTEREKVLELFKVFVIRIYGKDTARWLYNNWKHAESWHFMLIEHLKTNNIDKKYEILQIALIL